MAQKQFFLTTKNKTGIILSLLTLIFILMIQETAAASKPLAITDDLQRKVELLRPAVRIVSLSDSHTENLVAIRAVRQLVGVNFSADTKWVLKNIPRLSRLPSAEQIAGLKPDIVIMDADWAKMNKDLLKDLDKAKIKYAALNRPKWAVLGQYLDKLGALSGRSKEAAQTLLLSEKSLSKSDIRSGKTEKMRVFVVAGADYSTCAPDSWGARLIDATGARILTDSKGTRVQDFSWYIFYGPQKLADNAKNVDVIITLKNIGRGVPSVSRESIVNDPMFKNTPAVKNGRVWEMDESDLMLPSLVRLDSSLVKCWQLISYKTK
ncbi:MAG: ABC transporter substrate-binding protein [Synergistaceae bacterium]|jgi:ABC-type Fe3+-hydroxamate transport system substrate-binding protein|nr:ABC transporter substrate-binding protein [Synergistaceae bacterium]MDD2350202.1 ABC transporter substrate-binding protein [Synergistaceae bacterium]MDD3318774.1 ABC transporter substrate-binding protein [Synergistaceae bacterium]MDD3672122.1 ABC transporter substrate-binding protein [Synergistaceae bacterium]MDD3963464.1 ABC transporter substrate-binding protein [Synergistaceae bacterium]